jgi:hypothetical protein
MRQNLQNHLKTSAFTWIMTLVFGIGWWYFNFDPDYLKVVGIIHLLATVPALYLHTEYTIKNWNQIINITDNEIEAIKKGSIYSYGKSQVKKIIVVKAASRDRAGIRLTAIESYYYARLVMQNGEEIIITCLMANNIESELSQLRGVPVERIKKGFCSIEAI